MTTFLANLSTSLKRRHPVIAAHDFSIAAVAVNNWVSWIFFFSESTCGLAELERAIFRDHPARCDLHVAKKERRFRVHQSAVRFATIWNTWPVDGRGNRWWSMTYTRGESRVLGNRVESQNPGPVRCPRWFKTSQGPQQTFWTQSYITCSNRFPRWSSSWRYDRPKLWNRKITTFKTELQNEPLYFSVWKWITRNDQNLRQGVNQTRRERLLPTAAAGKPAPSWLGPPKSESAHSLWCKTLA